MGIGTDHCNLRLHLNITWVYDGVPSCRRYGLHDDSAEHVLFECQGLERERTGAFSKLTRECILPEEGFVTWMLRFIDISSHWVGIPPLKNAHSGERNKPSRLTCI